MGYGPIILRAVAFVESNLREEISTTDIADHVSYSRFHFHRLFQAVVDLTPGVYLRQRRLCHAARELITGNRRILDIAIDYQFGSQASFSRAFQREFGVPPGQFRQHSDSVDSLISPALVKVRLLHYRGGKQMVPKIISQEKITVIGLSYYGDNSQGEIPALWGTFCSRMTEIADVVGRCAYGLCLETDDYDETGKFEYIAALPVSSVDMVPQGMVSREIPAGEYAVFTHKGPVSALRDTYENIYGTWVKEAKLNVLNGFDFELYDHRFTSADDPKSELDIYIPLQA